MTGKRGVNILVIIHSMITGIFLQLLNYSERNSHFKAQNRGSYTKKAYTPSQTINARVYMVQRLPQKVSPGHSSTRPERGLVGPRKARPRSPQATHWALALIHHSPHCLEPTQTAEERRSTVVLWSPQVTVNSSEIQVISNTVVRVGSPNDSLVVRQTH